MSWVTIWLRYGSIGAFEEDPAFCEPIDGRKRSNFAAFMRDHASQVQTRFRGDFSVGDTNNAISMQGVHAYFRGGYDGGRR